MGAPNKSQKDSSLPDRDDTASISSAVHLQEIEYPEEELPAYTDEPEPAYTDEPGSSSTHIPVAIPERSTYFEEWYLSVEPFQPPEKY